MYSVALWPYMGVLYFCVRFLVTYISATVAPIGVKFRMTVRMCPGCNVSFPLLGAVPPGDPKIQNFGPLKSEYLENSKSQRNMSVRV